MATKAPKKDDAPKEAKATTTPKHTKSPKLTKIINSGDGQNKVPFSVVEAYKSLRVHLVSALSNIGGKVVAISSPNAAEGKSTTSINIAIVLSQLNKRVVLVDADARRASVHQKLKLDNKTGCTDILSGNAKYGDVLIKHNDYMDIITSGSSHNNATELFCSLKFDKLLSELKDNYDYVIVDTPPINLVSDALTISQKCDGILLLVRASVTTYEAFKKTLSSAEKLGINVLGSVMNGVGSRNDKYYRYNKYKYRYGYYNKRYNYYNSYYGKPRKE